MNKISNYSKLIRIFAYVQRFIYNCKNSNKKYGNLSFSELKSSKIALLQIAQQEMFTDEYHILKSGNTLNKKNRLISLSPFYDTDNNLIRVGGRLDNSCYSYNVKHPILLCSKHPLTKLIFEFHHITLLHAGPLLMLSCIRQNYWPLSGRYLAKRIVRTCVRCFRVKPKTIQPVMGNLPSHRTKLEFPFLNTGVDCAGPVLIADRSGRGARLTKSYLCIFICLAVKAVHIELVSSLTKEAYLAALNRFMARRGRPQTIYSDHGVGLQRASPGPLPTHRIPAAALPEAILRRVRDLAPAEDEVAHVDGTPTSRIPCLGQGQDATPLDVAHGTDRPATSRQRRSQQSGRHRDQTRHNSTGLQQYLSSTLGLLNTSTAGSLLRLLKLAKSVQEEERGEQRHHV
ncbi:uncharacterized protein LOC119692531 isoform X2 [Plutella xylostella]|uniref:uncharacterized protein LOC119692531 isoform X2 n=1 Tax=Plutella xylostella TaxID=51655 RepID=UPI002032F1CB|nr:uncharacterized protein LOC119692531 isoform X2 [Plutella xylostella]